MGDNNNTDNNTRAIEWISSRLGSDVPNALRERVGLAVFEMVDRLENADHSGHVFSEHLDVVLRSFMSPNQTRAEGQQVLERFEAAWTGRSAKDLFLDMSQLTKASLGQICKRLDDLMGPTFPDALDDEDEDGSVTGRPSVQELLRNQWGLGEVATTQLFEAQTKADKTKSNILLMELYLLVIFRFLEVQFGELEAPGSDSDGEPKSPVQYVTVTDLHAMNAKFQDKIMSGIKGLLRGQPFITTTGAGKRSASSASIRKGSGRSTTILDSDGASSDDDSSGSGGRSGSDEGDVDSDQERDRIHKGLHKLRGKGLASNRGEPKSLVVSVASRDSTAHYLFNDEPVPKVVRTAQKASRATFFNGTLKSLLDSTCATWSELGTEVSLTTIMSAVTSEYGMLILDMRGVPHTFKSSATKKRDPVLRCSILNPDGNEELTAMSMQSVSEYLFPLTDNHFDRNLDDQREKAMEPSFIKFVHPPVVRVKHLGLYSRKFRTLRQAHLWNRSSVPNTQANHFHITTWGVLLLFHINIWMLAMTRKDTSVLVEEFDTVWQAFYADRLRHGEPPKIPFRMVLILCEYRHDKCKSPGTSILYCAICGVNASRSTGGGGGEESPAVKQFYKAFRAWKATVKGDDKSVGKYLSLHPNVKKPDETSAKASTSSSAISVSIGAGIEAHVASQHRIMLHDSFEL